MKPLELAAYIRLLTHTNSTTFTDADMLVWVNLYIDEFASKIVEQDTGAFEVPYLFNLVADQREYAIGDDVLNRLHKVEIKFTSTEDRQVATYIKDYRGSETEAQITAQFSNSPGNFAYTLRRRAMLLLSGTIISVSQGVRMTSLVFPEKLANLTDNTVSMEVDPSTTTFGFPRQFHELLGRKVAIAWKGSQPKPIPLSPLEQRFEEDMVEQLAAYSTTNDEGMTRSGDVTLEDSGNEGWDF